MSEFTQISEYFSNDNKKSASVIKELGTNHYIVRFKSDAGTYFSASFESEETAEGHAEDWVS